MVNLRRTFKIVVRCLCFFCLFLCNDFYSRHTTQNRKIPIAASKTLYALPQRFAMDFAEKPAIYQLVFYACGAFQNRICLLLPHLWQYRNTWPWNLWIENKTWSRPIKTLILYFTLSSTQKPGNIRRSCQVLCAPWWRGGWFYPHTIVGRRSHRPLFSASLKPVQKRRDSCLVFSRLFIR